MASRTLDAREADLASLLDDGGVRGRHVLRPTWHFVRAEDIGWLLDRPVRGCGGSPASSCAPPMGSTSARLNTPGRRHAGTR